MGLSTAATGTGPLPTQTAFFLLDLPAITVRYYGRSKNLGWELTLDAGGSFGAADSLALPTAGQLGSRPSLTSVAQAEGYNHVAGITMSP